MKNLSTELKKWRKNIGLSQEKLAEKISVSRSTISKIESGKQDIDVKTLLLWAKNTNSEMQAAIVLFGTDVITNAAQLIQTLPMIIKIWGF